MCTLFVERVGQGTKNLQETPTLVYIEFSKNENFSIKPTCFSYCSRSGCIPWINGRVCFEVNLLDVLQLPALLRSSLFVVVFLSYEICSVGLMCSPLFAPIGSQKA